MNRLSAGKKILPFTLFIGPWIFSVIKGLLNGINPKAYANGLNLTQSQGHEYCELKKWLK